MNLSTDELRQRMALDLGSGHEPALDVARIAERARRTQQRRVVAGSATLAFLVAVGVGLGTTRFAAPAPDRGQQSAATSSASPTPRLLDIRTDTENSPPKSFIAAGRYAVSAVFQLRPERVEGGTHAKRIWRLYNRATQEYEKTDWSWLDVAPGLERAAVLEGELPTDRVGILDMKTRAVEWIELDHTVAGLAWSPDGTQLLATVYTENPDVSDGQYYTPRPSTRTGYLIINLDGASTYHALPALQRAEPPTEAPPTTTAPGDGPQPAVTVSSPTTGPTNVNARQDVQWSADGSKLWAPTDSQPDRVFYTLDGQRTDGDGQQYVPYTSEPAVSPDGKLAIGRQSGLPTNVVDSATGRVVGEQEALQLLAWADDDHLIAVAGCSAPCQGKAEFQNGLYLVSVDGKEKTQLSVKRTGEDAESWHWLLTRR